MTSLTTFQLLLQVHEGKVLDLVYFRILDTPHEMEPLVFSHGTRSKDHTGRHGEPKVSTLPFIHYLAFPMFTQETRLFDTDSDFDEHTRGSVAATLS